MCWDYRCRVCIILGVKMLKLKDKHPKCESDYKGTHFWRRIGIYRDDYILYQCQQCRKSVCEKIQPLNNEGKNEKRK